MALEQNTACMLLVQPLVWYPSPMCACCATPFAGPHLLPQVTDIKRLTCPMLCKEPPPSCTYLFGITHHVHPVNAMLQACAPITRSPALATWLEPSISPTVSGVGNVQGCNEWCMMMVQPSNQHSQTSASWLKQSLPLCLLAKLHEPCLPLHRCC